MPMTKLIPDELIFQAREKAANHCDSNLSDYELLCIETDEDDFHAHQSQCEVCSNSAKKFVREWITKRLFFLPKSMSWTPLPEELNAKLKRLCLDFQPSFALMQHHRDATRAQRIRKDNKEVAKRNRTMLDFVSPPAVPQKKPKVVKNGDK